MKPDEDAIRKWEDACKERLRKLQNDSQIVQYAQGIVDKRRSLKSMERRNVLARTIFLEGRCKCKECKPRTADVDGTTPAVVYRESLLECRRCSCHPCICK